jgi:hypothetical protein
LLKVYNLITIDRSEQNAESGGTDQAEDERRRMKQMGYLFTEFRFFVRPVRATRLIRDE